MTCAPGPTSAELITLPSPLPPPRMIASLTSIVLTWDPGEYEAFEIRISRFESLTSRWLEWTSRLAGKGEASLLLPDLLRDTTYRTTMAGMSDLLTLVSAICQIC